MQAIASDYEPVENEFEVLADGIYNIEGLSFMEKSLDATTKKPKLTDTQFGPVVMFNLDIVGSEDVAPLSCRINEIPYMVQAFTGAAGTSLPPVPSLQQVQAIETYLLLTLQLCNEGTKRPTLVVKKGWGSVYRLSGSRIPAGNYHGYFTDIVSKNAVGLPAPYANPTYPDTFQYDGLFLIVADQYGEQCGWSGVQYFQRYMKYKARATHNEKGELVADWVISNKTGEYTKSAKDFSNFVVTTAPSLFPQPPASAHFVDPHNICPEWIMAAQRDRILLTFTIDINTKGFNQLETPKVFKADPARLRFNVHNPEPPKEIPAAQEINGRAPKPAQDQKPILPDKHLTYLCDMLNILIKDSPPFTVPFDKDAFTTEHKDILKRLVTPLKGQLSTNKLNELTLVDVGTIFENIPFEEYKDDAEILLKISDVYAKLEVDEGDEF